MIVLFARQYAEKLIRFTARHEPKIAKYLRSLWLIQAERMARKEIEYAVTFQEVPLEWIFAWQQDYARFINEEIDPRWREAIAEAGDTIEEAIIREVGPFSFTPTGEKIDFWLRERAATLVRNLTDTQTQALRNILRHYIVEQPTSPDDLGRIIRSVVGLTNREALAVARFRDSLLREGVDRQKVEKQTERYIRFLHKQRGIRIARTEMSYAWNNGEYMAITQAQEQGILRGRLMKEWITAADERVCHICGPADGELVDKEQSFSNGFFIPPAHPNCRCAHAYMLEEV
ncbi:phage minor head protein [Atrimonas thermophila]|uniref:phage minor head protein n=1 Tax=Atrimonas thermophila TaxID=3064161 RepID=UPI00399C570D